MTDDVTQRLRDAYDRRVEARAMRPPPVWESVERDDFLGWLQRERKVATLLERFDFLPEWRVDDVMVSYAAPGGSVGPHTDQYDVFLVQAQGRRRWQLSEHFAPALRAAPPPRRGEGHSARSHLISPLPRVGEGLGERGSLVGDGLGARGFLVGEGPGGMDHLPASLSIALVQFPGYASGGE